MAKRLAIFDVDNTLNRRSLGTELLRQLAGEGIVSSDVFNDLASFRERYHSGSMTRSEYVEANLHLYADRYKGLHYGDVFDVAKHVAARATDDIYQYTSKLLETFQNEEYFLLAISHSPKFIVDEFCALLNFDKSYGVMFEIGPQSYFTGNITDLHIIMNKANVVKRVLELEKENVTLEGSVGVGDAATDISFLDLVDKAICFNGDQVLYKHAKRNGWNIVVEHKDVIYPIT